MASTQSRPLKAATRKELLTAWGDHEARPGNIDVVERLLRAENRASGELGMFPQPHLRDVLVALRRARLSRARCVQGIEAIAVALTTEGTST